MTKNERIALLEERVAALENRPNCLSLHNTVVTPSSQIQWIYPQTQSWISPLTQWRQVGQRD